MPTQGVRVRMPMIRHAALAALLILGGCSDPVGDEQGSTTGAPAGAYMPAEAIETPHFTIRSSATRRETVSVGSAVEALHRAYAATLGLQASDRRFQLVLYRDQPEFKKHNRSAPWAEAYYRRPYSFAYPGGGDNPHHWMLHEVTHQLLAEGSGYRLRRWLNEGMAGYFGSSRLSGDGLHVGEPDRSAYPVWWLASVRFDQASAPSFSGSRMPSLQQLVEETGAPVGENVNSYYVAWWSLVHYLMQGDGGVHRQGAIELLEQGGSADSFQRLIGKYTDIEPRWHLHLGALADSIANSPGDR